MQRAQEAIDAGFTNGELARAAGVSTGAVSQWISGETKSLKARTAIGLAALTGWSAEWWATGRGPKLQAPYSSGVAQPMSYAKVNIPPLMVWEELMTAEKLPHEFSVAMPDDSLRGEIERGTLLVFRTGEAPTLGRPVLCRLKEGSMHVRIYSEARGSRWTAKATHPHHASFDSEADELQIVATAVLRGF